MFAQMHGAGHGGGVAWCADIQMKRNNIPHVCAYKAMHAVANRMLQQYEHKDNKVMFAEMHGAGRGGGVAWCADIRSKRNNIPGLGGYKAMLTVASRIVRECTIGAKYGAFS